MSIGHTESSGARFSAARTEAVRLLICVLMVSGLFSGEVRTAAGADQPPAAVATFHCLGLYWKPAGGDAGKSCEVQYRSKQDSAWRKGFPLWFDSRNGEYRGSIVELQSGTEYEVELHLAGTDQRARLDATTWNEDFPIGKRIFLEPQSKKRLVIDQSGNAQGYVLYLPPEGLDAATIDVAGQDDYCVEIRASHVMLRGLVLKSPAIHAVVFGEGVHDVVVEGCDISGWGRIEDDGWGRDYDAAFYSKSKSLQRVVLQGNRMHHPRSNSNSWKERRARHNTFHPMGPQCINFFDSAGNHVFRYNEFQTDARHYCNDIFGAGSNFGERGFPNRDSDIYGNRIDGCWDDGIESEGANCNVRIWNNYIDNTMVKIAVAGCSVGPVYLWRNVAAASRLGPEEPAGEPFLKMGAVPGSGGGRIYVFHNTILQPAGQSREGFIGCGEGLAQSGGQELGTVISRNNILQCRTERATAVRDKSQAAGSSYDYDLFHGRIQASEGQEPHGIRGRPVFQSPPEPGVFSLAPSSPGRDQGVELPNFNDGYQGAGPDIGAHEAETPAMVFGIPAWQQSRTRN